MHVKKSIEVNTCYNPPTVASEIYTLRLFSCIISVIASYVITSWKYVITIITISLVRMCNYRMATQCCWNFTNMLLTTIALGHTWPITAACIIYSNCIVLFTVASSFLCFHEVMLLILYLALEPIIVHFTAHDGTCICMVWLHEKIDQPLVCVWSSRL